MITVIFSSHNGAETLPTMLEALRALRADGPPWKIVAVDNASTDETPQILQSYRRHLPLVCLTEPRRGKNIALNRALGEIEGEIVVATDDDVRPRPDWLLAIATAFEAHPDVDIIGGRIEPLWPAPPPEWLLRSAPLAAAYAVTPSEIRDGPAPPWSVWGPNMALRSRIFDAGHRFDESVGPDGSSGYAMGSETEFVSRLHAQGHTIRHCSAALVQHIIARHQMSRQWLMGRAFRFGRGQARAGKIGATARAVPMLAGVPRYLIGDLARAGGDYLAAACHRDAARRFAAAWQAAYIAGVICERRRSRAAAAPATIRNSPA